MKVVYKGESDPLELVNGREYEVVSVECGWYRIVDETHEDYLFPPELFDISESDPPAPIVQPERESGIQYIDIL